MKHEDIHSIVKKIKALDNEVKLKIFMLLVEEGAKSITDISKTLRLNFSTTHKYLEEMERAGVLDSKETVKNRLKRMFFVKDFHIELSPEGLAGVKRKKSKESFLVITSDGKQEEFDWDKFSKPYIERGIPRSVIDLAKNQISDLIYDGITTLELRNMLRTLLRSRVSTLIESIENLKKEFKRRSYAYNISLLYPDALKYHMSGSIFIRNLSFPCYQSFVHDLRGIAIHGIDGKIAQNITDLSKQLSKIITQMDGYVSAHGIDSFNYFLAPFFKKEKSKKALIKKFLTDLNAFDRRIFIGIEIGSPRFTSDLPTDFFMAKKTLLYKDYKKEADEIAKILYQLQIEEEYPNLRFLYKCWDSKIPFDFSKSKQLFYIANLSPEWQTDNASYVGDRCRLDCNWKQWLRTVRAGELQRITINLPRIALESENVDQFIENLTEGIEFLTQIYIEMVEQTLGEFLKYKQTTFESAHRERWNYAPVSDGLYSISIVGLNEAIYLLTKKELQNNLKLGEKILKTITDTMNKQNLPIRMGIKEENNPTIINRLYALDKREYGDKVTVKSYSEGAKCSSVKASCKLHKYLTAGHSVILKYNRKNLNEFLKSDGGLAKFTLRV